MCADKKEYENLNNIEDQIDIAWDMISELKLNNKSCIIGYDLNSEISRIENLLKQASQRTNKLKLAYENELSK